MIEHRIVDQLVIDLSLKFRRFQNGCLAFVRSYIGLSRRQSIPGVCP